jgi:hypothetical protein
MMRLTGDKCESWAYGPLRGWSNLHVAPYEHLPVTRAARQTRSPGLTRRPSQRHHPPVLKKYEHGSWPGRDGRFWSVGWRGAPYP